MYHVFWAYVTVPSIFHGGLLEFENCGTKKPVSTFKTHCRNCTEIDQQINKLQGSVSDLSAALYTNIVRVQCQCDICRAFY